MFLPSYSMLGCMVFAAIALRAVAESVWDFAPSFSDDPFPPYPPLTNPDGTNISVTNLRGTHLFKFKGCTADKIRAIQEAYADFHTLASQAGVSSNIDWTATPALDFWGSDIPENTRKEIQQIFAAAEQVYSMPWTWQPPWLSWRCLWIEVRCSDGKLGPSSSDPYNACGDAKPNDGHCPGGGNPDARGSNRLEAFSDANPDGSWISYSRITFCEGFFELPSFKNAIAAGLKLPARRKTDLENWNNRARCFFHEVTHLDYFMNAGGSPGSLSPYVSDLEAFYSFDGTRDWYACYGSFSARVLKNVDDEPEYYGYFTQRNADNYAYFALAKYVEKAIGRYPMSPSPGKRGVYADPRDLHSKEPPLEIENDVNIHLSSRDDEDPTDIQFPGCGDRGIVRFPADSISSWIVSTHGPRCNMASSTWMTPSPTQDPAACFCECDGGDRVRMAWGTSSSLTSSWCLEDSSDYAPTGWTQLPDMMAWCTDVPKESIIQ